MKRAFFARTGALCAVLICCMAVIGQSVDPTEKKILDYVDAHLDDAIALTQRIVNIDSPTENLQGVKNVGAELRKELEAIGLTAKWIDMPADKKRAQQVTSVEEKKKVEDEIQKMAEKSGF